MNKHQEIAHVVHYPPLPTRRLPRAFIERSRLNGNPLAFVGVTAEWWARWHVVHKRGLSPEEPDPTPQVQQAGEGGGDVGERGGGENAARALLILR